MLRRPSHMRRFSGALRLALSVQSTCSGLSPKPVSRYLGSALQILYFALTIALAMSESTMSGFLLLTTLLATRTPSVPSWIAFETSSEVVIPAPQRSFTVELTDLIL